MIGKVVLIEDSFIGPHTSIGGYCKICSSNLEYCAVQESGSVKGVERLEDSLIGKNAKVTHNQRNRRIKLHDGDARFHPLGALVITKTVKKGK